MARRKKKDLIPIETMFGLIMALAILGAIVRIVTSEAFISLVFFVCAVIASGVLLQRYLTKRTREKILDKSRNIVDEKILPLVRRRAQLVRQDDYGVWQLEKWDKEKDRFINQLIEPTLLPAEVDALHRYHAAVKQLIDARVEAAGSEVLPLQIYSDEITPSDFEVFCAGELRCAGWNARVTSQSRDQGTDIIAEKDGMRLVLQCKKYTRPVGNKAVQEIAAGKLHEQAQFAAVVSNNEFTPSAQQLASTTGVLLLHYGDLRNIESFLPLGRTPI